MQRLALPQFCRFSLLACLLFFFALPAAWSAEKPSEPDTATKPSSEAASEAQQVLRSYLQLQEQLHTALLAIERARDDAEAAARRNAETLAARLKLIEQAITLQREREMESIQSSNRALMIVAGIFAGVGFVTLLLTSLFQVRAMNRLAEIAGVFHPGTALAHRHTAVLGTGDSHVMGLPESSSARLLGVIERLEKRVLELEHTTQATHGSGESIHPNTASTASISEAETETAGGTTNGVRIGKQGRVALMLGKGQALLNLDQTESALACFEQVLALDPNNAEALVKKGSALERLKRLEEAIDCYDRAIAMNRSLTLAYLYKGGVYNQLERFNEALECYEQALRTQEKAPAA